ncbi:hypothetical protein BDZ45DRAFT_159486 [Acephala macrosclerotiorum]|nr:hypothetical protein BDZ45DRAFT_159486 [Acephala macrosclerotiorum]
MLRHRILCDPMLILQLVSRAVILGQLAGIPLMIVLQEKVEPNYFGRLTIKDNTRVAFVKIFFEVNVAEYIDNVVDVLVDIAVAFVVQNRLRTFPLDNSSGIPGQSSQSGQNNCQVPCDRNLGRGPILLYLKVENVGKGEQAMGESW